MSDENDLEAQATDYCSISLEGIRDEGPLIAAAGWLASACSAQEAGECGPHVVLPVLYNLRFSVELALHGATQALEEVRSCSGRTEQKTHDLRRLFATWTEHLGHSVRKLGWYGGEPPDVSQLWTEVEGLHQLDPDGTHLRYPQKMPAIGDVCSAADMAQQGVRTIVEVTNALVPRSKSDCRRRLNFLWLASVSPCSCLGSFQEWEEQDNLLPPEPNSVWPESWNKYKPDK